MVNIERDDGWIAFVEFGYSQGANEKIQWIRDIGHFDVPVLKKERPNSKNRPYFRQRERW